VEGTEIEKTVEAPADDAQALPDRAVPPPEVEREKPEEPREEPRGGPMQARAARLADQAAAMERAKVWAEMRHRDRQAQAARQKEGVREEPTRSAGNRLPLLRWAAAAAAILVVLALVGGGVYAFFFANREASLTAEEVWREFEADTGAANAKYKGKFVQVTGKVLVHTDRGRGRYFFEAPSKGAKWAVEFMPPASQVNDVKANQEITVRGRLSRPRGTDVNVVLSNCTLVRGK
jgi:hypothetical protein